MLAQVLVVLVLGWILFSAQEEHVFAKMSQPGQLPRIGHVANLNVERGSCLIGRWVADEEYFHAIGELQASVLVLVRLGLDNVVVDTGHILRLDGGHPADLGGEPPSVRNSLIVYSTACVLPHR
uniref:Putative secreted protein n=1 Tax=Ixodes ricinus TaxID=34613 RepID=A0A6B0UNT2_IXORI